MASTSPVGASRRIGPTPSAAAPPERLISRPTAEGQTPQESEAPRSVGVGHDSPLTRGLQVPATRTTPLIPAPATVAPRTGADGVPLLASGALATGNVEVDAVPLRAPQRTEHRVDDGQGGGIARVVRHAGIWWGFGLGDVDEDPAAPARLTGDDLRRDVIPHLQPGDIILMGAGGNVTHAAIHLGDGQVIHSMATEKTQRSFWGRALDVVAEPFRIVGELTGLKERRQGVFQEGIDAFTDRFYRDSYVVLRSPEMTPEAAARGIAYAQSLIGTGYDWDIAPGNDTYYCSEVVAAFYRETLGVKAPRISARPYTEHSMMRREGIVDPLDLLQSPDLSAVMANEPAMANYPTRLAHLVQ